MKHSLNMLMVLVCTASLFSCAKKEVLDTLEPATESNLVTIRASFANTKTSYENEITFSWNAGDQIGVWTSDGAGNYRKAIFEAKTSGPSVEFIGAVSAGYSIIPDGKAFYPDGNYEARNNFGSVFDGTTYSASLGGTIDVDLSNPMAVIPLVGNNDGSNNFTFTTATGILKVSYEHLQAATTYITIDYESGDTALNGSFTLENDEVKLANAVTPYTLKYLKVSNIPENGSGTFYFPIATGSLPAGLWFNTMKSNGNYLSSIQTTQEIPITRNKITSISVALDGRSDYRSIGTGKFLDNYLFSLAGHEGEAVDVEILQSQTNPNKFMIADPYGTARVAFGDELLFNNSNKQYGLVFWTLAKDEAFPYSEKTASKDNLVYFEPFETGYEYNNDPNNFVRISHTNFHSSTSLETSCVRSTQTSGLPAVVQFAPKYAYGTSRATLQERFTTNNQIVVLFPGCKESEILAGRYLVNGDDRFSFTIDNNDSDTQNIKITNYTNTASSISWDGSFKGVYDASTGHIEFNDAGYLFYTDSNNYCYVVGVTDSIEENLVLSFQEDGTLKSQSEKISIPAKISGSAISNQRFSGYPYLKLTL